MGGTFDGKEIREKLKAKGYSIQQIADALGVTRNAVYAKLKNPKYENLEEFASVMEEPVEYFLSSGRFKRNMELFEIDNRAGEGRLELKSVSKHLIPWLPDRETPWMGVQMMGDNMEPDISPEDILILDPEPQESILQDSIYLSVLQDGSPSINRLRLSGNDVNFVNHHPGYDVFTRDRKDIVRLHRVVEVVRRRRY